MLRISQTTLAALTARNHVVSQRSFDDTGDPPGVASSEAPVGGSDGPACIPARSAPPVPVTVDESTKPASSIDGWETEGGASQPVT